MSRLRGEQDRYRKFSRRAVVMGGAQLALFTTLGARMYYLQVVEAERYATLAEDNRVNVRLIAPPRGDIFDRYGTPLAVNTRDFRAILIAEGPATSSARSTRWARSSPSTTGTASASCARSGATDRSCP